MPFQRDEPRAREKPRTDLSVCQKVIVKKRNNRTAKFLHVLLMLQSSSSKLMTTLMLTDRPRNLQDLVFKARASTQVLFQACPVYFQETFRFSQCEFTEILSSIRDLDGDLFVDANSNPLLLRHIGQKPQDYIRCWSDSVLMILLCRLSRPCAWVTLQSDLGGSRAALSRIFTHMVQPVWSRYGSLVSDIYIWKSFFPDFVSYLEKLGAPYDCDISFTTATKSLILFSTADSLKDRTTV